LDSVGDLEFGEDRRDVVFDGADAEVEAGGDVGVGQSVGEVDEDGPFPVGGGVRGSWIPVLTLILGAIVFAAVWSLFFKRGPLEYLLNLTTKPVKYLK
jgi:hypothetical protein